MIRLILLTLAAATAPCVADAAVTFLGPSPYRSAADSPFDLSGLGSTFFLEDFEDEVQQPGMNGDPLLAGIPILEFIRQPGSSVDSDDGAIDDSGFRGFSALPVDGVDGVMTTAIVRFQFEVDVLGFYPTAVGLVLTQNTGSLSRFLAFSPEGAVSWWDTSDLVINNVGTADNRFIGVTNPEGISKVEFLSSNFGGVGLRIDHLQYGRIVPEATASALVVTGLLSPLCWPSRGSLW